MSHNDPFDVQIVVFLDQTILRVEGYPKVIRIVTGYFLVFAGILMLILPGPGLVSILAGCSVISPVFGQKVTRAMERYIAWRRK